MMKTSGKKGILLRATGLGILLIYLLFGPAYGGEAVLTDIRIANNKDHLLLSFNVDECFTKDMEAAIKSGIATTFNFVAKVYRVKRFWWNEKISDIKVTHHVKYDNLKKVYLVSLSENSTTDLCVQTLEEVKKNMSELRGLEVARLDDFNKGENYQVRMMAELDTIILPLKLHYVLFFLSLWDFETDWYSLDFVY